jgi:hypothetical protein
VTVEKIEEAVSEARRFIKRDGVAVAKAKQSRYGLTDCGKESGAVKRSSLDLTRALAEMRKP